MCSPHLGVQRSKFPSKRYFVVCQRCFWCVSCLGKCSVSECPRCRSDRLDFLPITNQTDAKLTNSYFLINRWFSFSQRITEYYQVNIVPNIEHLPGIIEVDVLDSFKILCRRLSRITDNAGNPKGTLSTQKLPQPKQISGKGFFIRFRITNSLQSTAACFLLLLLFHAQ